MTICVVVLYINVFDGAMNLYYGHHRDEQYALLFYIYLLVVGIHQQPLGQEGTACSL